MRSVDSNMPPLKLRGFSILLQIQTSDFKRIVAIQNLSQISPHLPPSRRLINRSRTKSFLSVVRAREVFFPLCLLSPMLLAASGEEIDELPFQYTN